MRDAYIVKTDGELKIVIYTRCGGPNRSGFQHMFDAMKGHPNYIKDYDCDIDNTYAYIEFSAPRGYNAIVVEFFEIAPEERGAKMFMKVVDDMKSGNETPFVKKALEVGEKIIGAIDGMDNGGIIEV